MTVLKVTAILLIVILSYKLMADIHTCYALIKHRHEVPADVWNMNGKRMVTLYGNGDFFVTDNADNIEWFCGWQSGLTSTEKRKQEFLIAEMVGCSKHQIRMKELDFEFSLDMEATDQQHYTDETRHDQSI